MESHRRREEWAKFVRRRTAELRCRVLRRLRGPAGRTPAGDGPRPRAPRPRGPRYDLESVVLGWTAGLVLLALFIPGWRWLFDSVLLPRVHPVELRPGDRVEFGAGATYRPVLVRHPDGSVTDTGPISSHLGMARLLPPFLAAGLAGWLVTWRRSRGGADCGPEAGDGAEARGAAAEPVGAPVRAGKK